MAFAFDEIFAYGGQIIVAAKKIVPKALGVGKEKIDHSAFIQGPLQVGEDGQFSSADATVMIGKNGTVDTPNSMFVKGKITHEGDDVQQGNTTQTGDVTQTGNLRVNGTSYLKVQGTINSQSWKGFDIKHPNKEGYRLRHVCLEGPEGGIYYRGRATKNVIPLPLYWKDLVDQASITVSITPIGVHQNIIVKRWDTENIYLQNQGALPINCFFHVFGQRIDGDRLIVEYEGETPKDYPGDQSQYSIAGYHYDDRD